MQFLNFLGVLGSGDPTEANCQINCLADGTWQYMACYIESPNNFNETTTISNRINASNGSMTISVLGGVSGYFEDVGVDDHDSVSPGDKLDYGFLASDVGNGDPLTMVWIGAQFNTTGSSMIGGSDGGVAFIGDTEYSSLFGGGQIVPGAPLARSTGLFPFAASVSNFTNYLPLGGGTATFNLLINGSSSLSVSSTGSGYWTDTALAAIAVGDTCANQIVASSSIRWASAFLRLDAS